MLHLAGKKAQAKGYLKDDGSFVVLKGSTFCAEETKSCQGKDRRAELLSLKQVVNANLRKMSNSIALHLQRDAFLVLQ